MYLLCIYYALIAAPGRPSLPQPRGVPQRPKARGKRNKKRFITCMICEHE